MTGEEDRLLREYTEAGNLCRSYESLSRTNLAIYVAFATAVAAVALRQDSGPAARITLEVVGLLFTGNVLSRTARLYKTYVDRAREIERKLGMSVYLLYDEAMKGAWTIRTKPAMLLVVGGFGILFLGLLILEACRVYASA